MLQCQDCEFGKELPDGGIDLTCDPARNIKEPECLTKWQLLQLQHIENDSALIAALVPKFEKIVSQAGTILCHVAEQQKGDDWKHGGADEDGG